MARGNQSKQRKLELLNKLSNHRSDITAKKQVLSEQISESTDIFTSQLKDKINVPKMVRSKVKSSFANSPNKWFIGSVAGGLLLSKLILRRSKPQTEKPSSVVEKAVGLGISSIFRSPKKRRQTHGVFYSLMGYAARPLLKAFVMGKVRNYVAHKMVAQQPREVYYEQPEEYHYREPYT